MKSTDEIGIHVRSFQDCYILDTMGNGIFVWIGKKCSQKEKGSSMDIASKFLLEKNYPNWTQVFNWFKFWLIDD